MKLCSMVKDHDKKIGRFEKLLWYISAVITIKFGGEAIPVVAALING